MIKLQSFLIVMLLLVIGLFIFFGGKKVTRFEGDIAFLQGRNSAQELEISQKDSVIARDKEIKDSLQGEIIGLNEKAFWLSAEKRKAIYERDEALAKLQTITSDSSYRFLQEVAYNYPGTLRYLFNELQVRGIHSDFIKLQASDQIINTLESQVNNCGRQVETYEKIKASLENIVFNQGENITGYKNIIENDSVIIKDLDKTAKKERHRKNFWRTSTGISILVLIGSLI